jgi:uncharacterized protein (TIGR02186 family)
MVLKMFGLLSGLGVLVTMMLATVSPVTAAGLVVDLSNDEVEITTDFNGSSVLMFGAVDLVRDVTSDVVVVVKGPLTAQTVRKKAQVGGVWLNTDGVTFGNVPAFYAVAANRPLHKIAAAEIRDGEEIGLEFLRFDPALESAAEPEGKLAEFQRALIRNKREAGLYRASLYPLQVLSGKLFRTEIWFPANVATGAYRVVVYVLKGGQIIERQAVTLTARKVGVGAEIYRFAHQQSAAYGIAAIIIAVAAGWLAAAVFRKT